MATIAKTEWLLGFAYSALGDAPIKAVDAPTILDVLRSVEVRGRYESARRLRSTIGSVFRYAIATARADMDPTYALRGATAVPVYLDVNRLVTEHLAAVVQTRVTDSSSRPNSPIVRLRPSLV